MEDSKFLYEVAKNLYKIGNNIKDKNANDRDSDYLIEISEDIESLAIKLKEN